MIFTVGKDIPDSERYTPASLQQFLDWEEQQKEWQFDVETNITRTSFGRIIHTMQFGEVRKNNFDVPGIQFFINWASLSVTDQEKIKNVLRNRKKRKLIHNATFEYESLLNYDVVLENVFDTMLAEKIKWTGFFTKDDDEEGNSFFSLAGCMYRYFQLIMDKSYQTSFGTDDPLTVGQVLYAVADVTDLDQLADIQVRFLTQEGLINVLNLENEAVLAFGDITWHGMRVNQEKWLENLELAEPVIVKYKAILDEWLIKDPKMNAHAVKEEIIASDDTVEFNKNSPVHKQNLLKRIFPDIEGATLPIIKKYLRGYIQRYCDDVSGLENISELEEKEAILISLTESDWTSAFLFLVQTDKQWLIDNNYLIPKGTIRINWNSPVQVLAVMQTVDKSIQDFSEKTRNTFEHPIVPDFEAYKGALKLVSSYGQKFLDEFIDFDGRVRTRINQILDTGRVSSSKPNMQQIPIIEDDDPKIANRYRNCFIPDPGFMFVDSDYSSQELALIAHASQDPVWLNALEHGHDLHSICAALVYGQRWTAGTEPNCVFASDKQKCKCKKHKSLRNAVKTINFGLAYGMTQYKLAGSVKITVKEAEALIDAYFKTFPSIGQLLANLGGYGVQTGLIKTLYPFNRKRWFPDWDKLKMYIEPHIKGIKFNKYLGRIERQAKNTPIQGSAADMMKYALVLIRRHINDNNLRATHKLVMQVHDQATTEVRSELAEAWKPILTDLMEKAAKLIIPSGLLKADTNKTLVWEK